MGPLELSELMQDDPGRRSSRVKHLCSAIRDAATTGILTSGEPLPSTRAAAQCLGMSRNGVQDAYEALVAEGVIKTARGRAPIVCDVQNRPLPEPVPTSILVSARGQDLAANTIGHGIQSVHALSPGLPDPDLFPHDQWARVLRRAARHRYGEAENYAQYNGVKPLRTALAKHLLQTRGVRVSPDEIIITTGTQTAARLMASIITDRGDAALVEDPGYGGARAVLKSMGLSISPMAEDSFPPARLAYVTPSTQYPTGTRMPLQQRQLLLAWAARENAAILEDDYDSDFVWRHRDIPPLFALDQNSRVIMLGTVSKSLLPSLRLGWVILPTGLRDTAIKAHRTLGLAANMHVQSALALFMNEGLYARQVRRTSEVYRVRKDIMVAALQASVGDQLTISDPEGGLQLMLVFNSDIDDVSLSRVFNDHGFHPLALSLLCQQRQMTGLVVGFAGATKPRAEKFASLLAKLLSGATRT